MSINFCTIGSNTVGTLCGYRRARVLQRLLDEKYTPVVSGSSNHSVARNIGQRHLVPLTRIDAEQYETPALQFEQPFVTVSAELFGQVGQQTIEARPHLEFVTVVDLTVGAAHTDSVSVSDLTFSPPLLDVTVNITDFSI